MDDLLRVKRVQRIAGGAWLLISDDKAYEPEMVKPDGRESSQSPGLDGAPLTLILIFANFIENPDAMLYMAVFSSFS